MYIALFVGTLELSSPTNQTISVCSMEKWYFRITSNWMGVEEKGCVYLVSVEVPAGTEEKSYDEDDGDLYANVCMYMSAYAYVSTCVYIHMYVLLVVVRGMWVHEGVCLTSSSSAFSC